MRRSLVLLVGLLVAAPAVAQTRLAHHRRSPRFAKAPRLFRQRPSGLGWISDTHYIWPRPREPRFERYRRSSALAAAKDLHGELLLIHGVIDDNVHMQNTMKFAYELQKAGKPLRLMLYERSRHGVTDPALVKHMRQMMLDFTTETLLRPAGGRQSTAARR